VGISETRRAASLTAQHKEGSSLYLGDGEGVRRRGGIGFIISKDWSAKIASCQIRSARVGTLFLQLNKKKTLKVIKAKTPTVESTVEELEEFYDDLEEKPSNPSSFTVVMGDFNTKLGRSVPDECYTGKHEFKERNERGNR
ncbi:hypothetical protein Tcan_00466, partial [Toxocara canis]